MPETVAEIMDPEFFHACQTDSIGRLLHEMEVSSRHGHIAEKD